MDGVPPDRPVAIAFGWAAGGPETELRALTEAADTALLARKRSRPRPVAA